MTVAKILACLFLAVMALTSTPIGPDLPRGAATVCLALYFVAFLIVAHQPKDKP